MKKLSGLGKGLGSLIPNRKTEHGTVMTPQRDDVFYIETASIHPNANQPRQDFDQKRLKELSDSIKKYGMLQPMLVAKMEEETDRGLKISYQIIAGERRWRAAQLAKLASVPVMIKDQYEEDKVKLEVALVENLQREDLNPYEEAEAYSRLAKDFNLTQKVIATRVGKSREFVANTMRLLELPAPMKEALRSGKLSRTQARTLLAFKDAKQQTKAFKAILAGSATVRNVEAAAKEKKINPASRLSPAYKKRFEELQTNLTENLNSPVLIKHTTKGGKLEIKFADLEELNTIAKAILG